MVAHEYDLLVIGAGPAGLSAALYLARYERTVGLFDAGMGRSSWHQTAYNYLGFPGGIKTRELRELGRRQLADYPQVTIHSPCWIETMQKDNGSFIARGPGGEWHGRAVILCTGVTDHWPKFDDWEEYVGRSMFWCLTCDGYSSRNMKIVVVGNTDAGAVTALQLQRFDCPVTLLTNSDKLGISEEVRQRLKRHSLPMIQDKLASASGHNGYFTEIRTEGGQRILLDRLFSQQGATPNTKLALDLGVGLNEEGCILVDNEQKTNVPGVYAAGDVDRLHSHQISSATHEGGQAASAANYYLYPPDLKEDWPYRAE
jgi:thioredoxin reductase (NADPH)